MTTTDTSFIGSIPEHYDKYLGPLIFEEYSIDLASRLNIPDGGSLLEIAAGTGLATRHLKAALPSESSITVTDLNEPMLEIAKKIFPIKKNMHFQTADALDLPFEDAIFDAIACQFGIMFFPDKQKGINEAFRVLKPGGEYLFSVWDNYEHNPLPKLVTDTLTSMIPENPLSFLDVAFGYFSIDKIKRKLRIAGFGDIEIAILPRMSKTDHAKNVPLGFIMGNPLSLQIPARGGDVKEVIEKISNVVIDHFGTTRIAAPMQAIIFKAHKPIYSTA